MLTPAKLTRSETHAHTRTRVVCSPSPSASLARDVPVVCRAFVLLSFCVAHFPFHWMTCLNLSHHLSGAAMPRTRGARLLFGVFGSVFAVILIAVPHSTQVTALADAPCLYTLDFYFLLFTISLALPAIFLVTEFDFLTAFSDSSFFFLPTVQP